MNSDRRHEPLLSTLLLVLLIAVLGLLALHYATSGFQVVSTEAGRRLAVERSPPLLPPAMLRRAVDGATLPLADDLATDRRVAIVTFAYTRCRAICSAAGSEMQQLQARIASEGLADRVRLVTISFDPADDAATLRAHARGLRADPALWRFYGAASNADRRRLLDAFGVVAVPVPVGDYMHNDAYHIVDRTGRLRRIVDIGEGTVALAMALCLEPAI